MVNIRCVSIQILPLVHFHVLCTYLLQSQPLQLPRPPFSLLGGPYPSATQPRWRPLRVRGVQRSTLNFWPLWVHHLDTHSVLTAFCHTQNSKRKYESMQIENAIISSKHLHISIVIMSDECVIRTGYGAAAQPCFQFFPVATRGIATKNPLRPKKYFPHRPPL